jgi:hypothetical protein
MIKIVKLVTGEEVIGEVENSTDTTKLTLKSPCALHLVPSRSNPDQVGMALVPYASQGKEHKVAIAISAIVWEQEPVDELRNQYNSIFGNGIVIAKSLTQ